MIVRDVANAWQVVLQTDHADLSGQFAQAWGNSTFASPTPLHAVTVAATRHDDGWSVWERAPSFDRTRSRPRNFLDVQVLTHLAFYRADIAAVLDDDPYAGLLVSMHGAGIYRGRYGTQPSLKLTYADEEREQVDAFVREQEERYGHLAAKLGIDENELWINYRMLQVFDRLSLYFCLKDAEHGEPEVIEHTPTNYAGEEVALSIEPLGSCRVRMKPFPFAESPAVFTLRRRQLPKRSWADDKDFRRDFFALMPESTCIVVTEH